LFEVVALLSLHWATLVPAAFWISVSRTKVPEVFVGVVKLAVMVAEVAETILTAEVVCQVAAALDGLASHKNTAPIANTANGCQRLMQKIPKFDAIATYVQIAIGQPRRVLRVTT
jgi:hypothetical protein